MDAPLDEDAEHASYDPGAGRSDYFAAATQAALVLAAFRAPYRGRSTPVNAWWGTFDLAVACSPVSRPTRRRRTSSCATPGTRKRSRSAGGPGTTATRERRSSPTLIPPPEGFADGTLSPAAARWDAALGEYILDWDDVRAAPTRTARR